MKITFCGAAGEVTGSQHLIECGKLKVLLDCGLFQGHREESRRKNETFFHKPEQVDAVILSHAHIDHCGNLPNFHRQGFNGPVYCTPPTVDIAEIMLEADRMGSREVITPLALSVDVSRRCPPMFG
jgi:metallo-beta-lactamase family protein